MADFGTSDHPAVRQQLDRLAKLSLPQGRFGLDTMRAMMARLDNPHRKLPPVFHVAGTNGKGSSCAFLRAMLEADGKRVHVTSSPHLVRYNERIRIAGTLIEDDYLAELLAEVLDSCEGLGPSFFEVTIAASFLAFSRNAADACVIEVGLGGRFDATNVIEQPAVCGIAALGIDHEQFLLAPEEGTPDIPIARIAFEKAGIAKAGAALVTQSYAAEAALEIEKAATKHGVPLVMRGNAWNITATDRLHYSDDFGDLDLPLPSLFGAHQAENAGLAIAMLRHQRQVPVSEDAIKTGAGTAQWPARMQRLKDGRLHDIDHCFDIWVDGGHNANAAEAIRETLSKDPRAVINFTENGPKINVILGMLSNKNAQQFIQTIAPVTDVLVGVPIPGHDCHSPGALRAMAKAAGIAGHGAADDVESALHMLNRGRPNDEWQPVAILGSLYLAGEVLKLHGELPD
ncbi:bifunctional folylpolyglutamate synthase/dihydrofolate synthase [Altererythrobacter sp. RZ02]|uniref:tetrahydrofolate synthase n=1 Tax=Pontixanthobacter rizhaonensis TaxID=2730337 RepID=A0A848QLH6_9SPHN|nr:bifunctional folylpolyglutamate synthase/dihydrofolate synthase [Pontixanthobacter rizhaonensis]